ncbi:hypothetical protein V8G54_015922 [Vigna mungo]|uniref:Uncharacterized protein n=1 Tax=Vigna mungo TaxID=3915 RepID=A0AAQ3NN30_VIGMU
MAPIEALESYTQISSHPFHKTNKQGIISLDILYSKVTSVKFVAQGESILTGSADKVEHWLFILCSIDMQILEPFPTSIVSENDSMKWSTSLYFFSELMKEASDMVGYFSSRVQRLLHLHISIGLHRYVLRLRQCFKSDRQTLTQEGRILIKYIGMNAIAFLVSLHPFLFGVGRTVT